MISGYMQIPREKLGPTLLRSGHGGVFFQRLARDGVQPNADVEWHSWVEGQSYEEYHQSAMNRAVELKSCLTIRKGDGSNLGVITDKLLHRDRHWAIFGIQQHAGPNTVTGILQELGWEVVHRPSEPGSKNRPWTFFGKPKNDEMKDNYTYVHPDENNSEQYLRICIHNRHRKLQEDEIEHFDNKLKWWDATVSPSLRYEPEIAPTLPDSPEEKTDNEKTSPLKKRQKRLQDLDLRRLSPGGHKLEDMGGCGDCAYRCVAFGLAYLNAKGFEKSPEEENKVRCKVKELGQVLRVQAVTHRLSKDTAWQSNWAADDTATEKTEAGTNPKNLEQFKVALKRELRWACGLTLQAIATIKRVNLIVFEDKANQWVRTGLITCEDGNSAKQRKSLVLVLHVGHYYLVGTSSIDESWLNTEELVWCSKSLRPQGFFTRGGVGKRQTPSRKSTAALEELCRPCSTIQSPGRASAADLKGCDIGSNALRACSTKLSHWLRPGSGGSCTPNKGKQVKKDTGLLNSMVNWTCKICGFQLEGKDYNSMRAKMEYHLHKIHAEKYQEKCCREVL